MKSVIREAVSLKYEPVAILLAEEAPEDAKKFKEGKWGCVMFLLGAALKGRTAVFDRKTFGCWGGGVGLGFGKAYKAFPGGEEGFCRFLSTGVKGWPPGEAAAEGMKPHVRESFYDDYVNGECYVKTPELVADFVENLPITDVPATHVVFKPLHLVDRERETPEVVAFLGDLDEISALVILANYGRDGNENVIAPYAAGCQTLFLYPHAEGKKERPRGVLGLWDISARVSLKRQLKDDVMSFSVPWSLYREMEANVPGSFLFRNTWKELMALKKR